MIFITITCIIVIRFIVTVTVLIDRAVSRRAGEILFNHIKEGCLICLLKVEQAVDA